MGVCVYVRVEGIGITKQLTQRLLEFVIVGSSCHIALCLTLKPTSVISQKHRLNLENIRT